MIWHAFYGFLSFSGFYYIYQNGASLFPGLLLPRKIECKKAVVFSGSDESGKAEFTRLIELTLGDYAVPHLVDAAADGYRPGPRREPQVAGVCLPLRP